MPKDEVLVNCMRHDPLPLCCGSPPTRSLCCALIFDRCRWPKLRNMTSVAHSPRADYSCTYWDGIPRQGWLYISGKRHFLPDTQPLLSTRSCCGWLA